MWTPFRTFPVLIVPTSLAVLLATRGISFGAEATQEKIVGAEATQEKTVHFLPQLQAGDERFWIVLALILLMGGLFVVLFWWQKKIEQSGYFANIYRTTVENIETARLSHPLDEKWAQGAYLSEIYLQYTTRGKEWAEKNKRPEPTRDLLELASTLGYESEIRAIEWSLHTPPRVGAPLTEGRGVNPFSGGNRFPGTAPPGLAGATVTGSLFGSEKIDKEANQKAQKFWSLRNDFRDKADDWVNRAVAHAWSWYQTELEGIKGTARKQAQRV
jgi:hypothetical protein